MENAKEIIEKVEAIAHILDGVSLILNTVDIPPISTEEEAIILSLVIERYGRIIDAVQHHLDSTESFCEKMRMVLKKFNNLKNN